MNVVAVAVAGQLALLVLEVWLALTVGSPVIVACAVFVGVMTGLTIGLALR